MRIGLFGGTFDPVHLAHLRAALEVREKYGLERVYLVPSAVPPHKISNRVTDAATRIDMLRAAVAGDTGFVVSDIELKRSGPSYTIDTVRQFASRFEGKARLHLILGLDAFLEIDTWKSYSDLLSTTPVIVMRRPGAGGPGGDDMGSTRRFVTERLSREYTFSADLSRFVHPARPSIQLTNITAMDISSTRIRHLLRVGRSIRFLVPEPVQQIIVDKGLYK